MTDNPAVLLNTEWSPRSEWGYEGPDESVGIFGEVWWHEDCPLADDRDNEIAATEEVDGFDLILTCPQCQARCLVEGAFGQEPDF
jgi:hypothetical protein